ncbi:MAG: YggT family protein [Peptostreptococcaceae bacterium]|jgi:YggT family protein|nr:YggT family protein [Peptostreptococcaceae bacterium]
MLYMIRFIDFFIKIFELLVIARILLGFFQFQEFKKVYSWTYQITEPALAPIRNTVNKYLNLGMFDVSPIILFILLAIMRNFLIRILFRMYF